MARQINFAVGPEKIKLGYTHPQNNQIVSAKRLFGIWQLFQGSWT